MVPRIEEPRPGRGTMKPATSKAKTTSARLCVTMLPMDESSGAEESKNDLEIEKALREYNQALEIGHHADTLIHEVTAIVWGANTLLLGFILEVPCESKNQILVIVAAIVGTLLTFYVPVHHHLTKIIQKRIAYPVARKIERYLSLPNKLHAQINAAYPNWRPGLIAVWILTGAFVLAWVGVIWHACACLSGGG